MADTAKETIRHWGSSFMSGAFGAALALLLVLVLRSIAVQITPPPEPMREPYPDVSTPQQCEAAGGTWIDNPPIDSTVPRAVTPDEKLTGFCQGPLAFERTRLQQEEDSRETSLFVFAIGGTIAVAVGLFLRTIRGVAPGLVLGGIVSFFIATVHVWQMAPGMGRLLTIIALFIILTGIGVYIFREKK